MPTSIYQSIFDLIQTHIYGGAELTADMNLVCTLISTIGCIAFVALPFFVVYKIISMLMNIGTWR